MMAEVIKFYPKDAAKEPDAVLEQAIGQYESVFMIGYDKDGHLDVRASTNINHADILFLIESFKYKMLNGDYSGDKE
ncbi:hypothetical protein D3C78_1876430 [compost metagenome]